MNLPSLSTEDQRLVTSLFVAHVLQEAKIATNLSRTLVVTDFANPHPEISFDVVTPPAHVITIPAGGCTLHDITSDADHEERRGRIVRIMRSVLHEKQIEQIALVASVSAMNQNTPLLNLIDQLRSAEAFVQSEFGKKRDVHNFICLKFPDGNRAYTMRVNMKNFNAWYDRYEREVLGYDDRALADDAADTDNDPFLQ